MIVVLPLRKSCHFKENPCPDTDGILYDRCGFCDICNNVGVRKLPERTVQKHSCPQLFNYIPDLQIIWS